MAQRETGRPRADLAVVLVGGAVVVLVALMVVTYPALRQVAETAHLSIPWLYPSLPAGMILTTMYMSVVMVQQGRSWWWPNLPGLLLGGLVLVSMLTFIPADTFPPMAVRVGAVLASVALWAAGLSVLVHRHRGQTP